MAARSPRVLVIINAPRSGPRRLTGWLEESGLDVVEIHGSDGLPSDLIGFDGLVMLGGGLMPNDFEAATWLHAEHQLTLEAIEADLPTLGICLGAQIIVHAAGGEVRAKFGPKERGSTPIHLTVAGKYDHVLRGFGETAPMIENHEDMITRLPQGAVLLASSDAVENQAFVMGSHVRGVQFHPEVSAADLEHWDEGELREEGLDLISLRVAAETADEENLAASRALFDAFASQVRDWSVSHTH